MAKKITNKKKGKKEKVSKKEEPKKKNIKKKTKKKDTLKKRAKKAAAKKKDKKRKETKKQKGKKKSTRKGLAKLISVVPKSSVMEISKRKAENVKTEGGTANELPDPKRNFADHSSNYNVEEAVKILRSLKHPEEVDAFTKEEKRITITRVIPGVKNRLEQ